MSDSLQFGRRAFLKQAGLTAGALLAARGAAAQEQKRSRPPNIVLIYTDDQDFDELSPYDPRQFPCATGAVLTGASKIQAGAYSDPRMLTPNMQRLADEGALFTRFYITSSVCTPSRYSTLTGRYASRCPTLLKRYPAGTQVTLQWNTPLGPEETNVAKAMKARGYATGFVGKWHNGSGGMRPGKLPPDADPKDPAVIAKIDAGYNRGITHLKRMGFDYVGRIWNGNKADQRLPEPLGDNNLEWIAEGAREFMESNRNSPFFLYMPLTVPHGGYSSRFTKHSPKVTSKGFLAEPPKSGMPSRQSVLERLREAGIQERNAMGTWLDDCLGTILQKISDLGLDESTAVFFISDHQSRGKYACYEGCRVPALIRWPGTVAPGTRIEALCANIDLAPTFMSMADQPAKSEDRLIDGRSFLPMLKGAATPPDWRSYLLLEVSNIRAAVGEQWKYIANRPDPGAAKALAEDAVAAEKEKRQRTVGWDGQKNMRGGKPRPGVRFMLDSYFPCYFDPDQLYDLKNDVFEQTNVADRPENAAILSELKQALGRLLAPLPHTFAEFK